MNKIILDNITSKGEHEYLFQIITSAARTSYNGYTKGYDKDKALLEYLYKFKHSTPFEFIQFTFTVTCPIFVARQWLRHRTFSYNEVSYRYTEVEDNSFYIPENWRYQDDKNKQGSNGNFTNDELKNKYIEACEYSFAVYQELIDSGVAKEMARMILPVSTNTKFKVTGNLRNWLHFISLRSDSHAQLEIQEYSNIIRDIVFEQLPEIKELTEKYGY